MPVRGVETVLLLVVLATTVAGVARRLRVPAPSLLVLAGLAVASIPGVPTVQVTPDTVSLVVLPPLLYTAGEELSWRDLRHVWRPVGALSFGLVLASAAAVGAVARLVTPLPWSETLVLGAILASTDPVAMSALGRELSLPPKLNALVQAESLFNDATSLVLFQVAVALAVSGGRVTWGDTVGKFALLAGGGALIGAVAGVIVAEIRRRTVDETLETTVVLATPYAIYLVAQGLHTSGVTAVASVLLGIRSRKLTTPHIRLHLHAVHGTVVFILESVVFSLIGLQLPRLIREIPDGSGPWLAGALAVTAALVAVRVLWVFPLAALNDLRHDLGQATWRTAAVASWAGTRGVVALAAALSIPATTTAGAPVPLRDLIVLLATSVIVITLVAQGLTLAPLVRFARVAVSPDDELKEETLARRRLVETATRHLEQLAELEAFPDVVIAAERRFPSLDATLGEAHRRLRHELVRAQAEELAGLYDAGLINDATRRRLQRELDLTAMGIGDEE
jgi:CPA1 family monovalent cation:H+ antiporter